MVRAHRAGGNAWRHGKPHLEQDQIGKRAAPSAATCGPHGLPGRSLELRGDAHPRGMVAHDRTRLMADSFFMALARQPFNVVEATPTLNALSKIKEKEKENFCGREGAFKKTI